MRWVKVQTKGYFGWILYPEGKTNSIDLARSVDLFTADDSWDFGQKENFQVNSPCLSPNPKIFYSWSFTLLGEYIWHKHLGCIRVNSCSWRRIFFILFKRLASFKTTLSEEMNVPSFPFAANSHFQSWDYARELKRNFPLPKSQWAPHSIYERVMCVPRANIVSKILKPTSRWCHQSR